MTSRSRLPGTSLPTRVEYESPTVPTVPKTPGVNKVGSTWRSGTGAPDPTLGVVTDWYLDVASGDLYEKTGHSTWTLRFNFSLLESATATALHITRAQIPSSPITLPRFTISGNTTPGDLGSGATYKLGTSGGPRAIQDALGTWFELDLSGGWGRLGWFGCVGNGVTDDTAAAQLALTTLAGKVVEIEPATFAVEYLSPASNTLIKGSRSSVLKRKANATTNFPVINIYAASNITLEGFSIDGNKANQTVGASNIQAYGGYSGITIEGLHLSNAKSVSGAYGAGVALSNGTNAANRTQGIVRGCRIIDCEATGVQVSVEQNVTVELNYIEGCGGSGIAMINYVFPPTYDNQLQTRVLHNHCKNNNGNGIGYFGYVLGGSQAAQIYGPYPTSCTNAVIMGNFVEHNATYGIAIAGSYISVTGNISWRNGGTELFVGGYMFTAFASVFHGNVSIDNSFYGVDAGGSQYSIVSHNLLMYNGQTVGGGCCSINLGASLGSTAVNNTIVLPSSAAGTGIGLPGLDGDGFTPFGWLGAYSRIKNNMIHNPSGNVNAIGIWTHRRYIAGLIKDNDCYGFYPGNAVVIENTGVRVSGNTDDSSFAGGSSVPTVASAATMVIPDTGHEFYVSGTTNITFIRSRSQNTWFGRVRDIDGAMGSGYSTTVKPTIAFSGGGGTGAAATAEVSNDGKLVGWTITNPGSGYTSAPTATITHNGGSGATATALIGCDNLDGREITLQFLGALTVNDGGNIQIAGNFVTSSIVSILRLRGAFGGWYEISRATS